MRLCYIANANSIHTVRWVTPFVERGNRVYLLSPQPVKRRWDGLEELVDLTRLTNARKLRFVYWGWWVRRYVRRLQPDILHAHQLTGAGWLGAMAGYHPFVVSGWGSDILVEPEKSVFRRWLVKTVARRCDRLTVPSPSMIQAAHALGVPEDRLRLIPWGIETDIFTPTPNDRAATRAELGIGAADTVILCPRGLAAVYNIDVVLRAVNSVTGLYPNLRLALLHFNIKPAYLKKLQAAVAQLGLEKTVLWLPPQDTAAGMARLYRMADIVISIPSSEGYGFTVFEAMAAGCPTIISDLPAFRGQLEHGLHTLKVPPRSVRAAAAALTDLLAAAALRRTLRQNGLTLCRAQSIATRIAKTDALYKGLTA